LRDVVEDFTIMGDLAVGECRSSVEEDAAAFRFVTAKAGPGVSGDLVVEENSVAGVDSAGRPRLPRGALVEDCSVEELAFPPPGFKGRRASQISHEVSFFFSEEGRKYLVRPPEAVDWERMKTIKNYWSPGFQTRDQRLMLALRLFLSGMISVCSSCVAFVSLFGVLKGYTDSGERIIRAVWDERICNLLFWDPPWTPQGSPGSLAAIDLSNLSRGEGLGAHVGDLPLWFYALRIEAWLLPFFVLPDISPQDLYDYGTSLGYTMDLDLSAPFLAISALLMGWS
jgi:hypothetical protein